MKIRQLFNIYHWPDLELDVPKEVLDIEISSPNYSTDAMIIKDFIVTAAIESKLRRNRMKDYIEKKLEDEA